MLDRLKHFWEIQTEKIQIHKNNLHNDWKENLENLGKNKLSLNVELSGCKVHENCLLNSEKEHKSIAHIDSNYRKGRDKYLFGSLVYTIKKI